jgi:Flp pilus assembly protein TadG
MNPIRSIAGRLKRAAVAPSARRAGFMADKSGVAAVEFALILPFLLLVYFGTAEVGEGVMLNRKTSLTAATVANIVAQYTTISASSQLPDILNVSTQIFSPYSASSAGIIVSCVSIDSSGKATVSWSQAQNATARSAGQAMTVPAALDLPNTSLIFSETSYAYTAPVDFLKIGVIHIYDSVYMSPRASTTVNLIS